MGSAPTKSWPRLSETLTFARHPESCQACGTFETPEILLGRWQEHDEQDRPEPVVIVLCEPCATRIIEKHPRLYRKLEALAPWPGCMPLCVACMHRDGVRCRHPDLKANGGPGLALRYPKPTVGFWDGRTKGGRRTGGRLVIYHGPVSHCASRTEAEPSSSTSSVD